VGIPPSLSRTLRRAQAKEGARSGAAYRDTKPRMHNNPVSRFFLEVEMSLSADCPTVLLVDDEAPNVTSFSRVFRGD